ncbi:hypothetical protein VNI00_014916 [Paramarasmius palmivorus]|uniref:Uncharacterized protein n=1 Tax=Paramarasmius palmivorus TaxID=297713 RepID=A0AAW0BNZ6_9AGAR
MTWPTKLTVITAPEQPASFIDSADTSDSFHPFPTFPLPPQVPPFNTVDPRCLVITPSATAGHLYTPQPTPSATPWLTLPSPPDVESPLRLGTPFIPAGLYPTGWNNFTPLSSTSSLYFDHTPSVPPNSPSIGWLEQPPSIGAWRDRKEYESLFRFIEDKYTPSDAVEVFRAIDRVFAQFAFMLRQKRADLSEDVQKDLAVALRGDLHGFLDRVERGYAIERRFERIVKADGVEMRELFRHQIEQCAYCAADPSFYHVHVLSFGERPLLGNDIFFTTLAEKIAASEATFSFNFRPQGTGVSENMEVNENDNGIHYYVDKELVN